MTRLVESGSLQDLRRAICVDDRTFSCRFQCGNGKAGTVPVLVLLLGPGRFGSISWVLQVFAVLNPYSKWPYDCDLATGNKKCKAR